MVLVLYGVVIVLYDNMFCIIFSGYCIVRSVKYVEDLKNIAMTPLAAYFDSVHVVRPRAWCSGYIDLMMIAKYIEV